MKEFLKDHSYDMVKMFLNQFATAIFGFSLVMAAGQAENVFLRNATSVFSVLFYLFLIYITAWDIGYRDKVSVDSGRKKRTPWKGVRISLCANALNFLLAIFIMLAALIDAEAIDSIGAVATFITIFIEGMYTGLLANSVGGVVLNSIWAIYFLLPIPALIVSGVAYQFGVHDVKFTSAFNKQAYPESDRAPKRKDKRDD